MRFGRHIVIAGLLALVAALISPAVASATHGGDTEVSVGSNDNVFSQNKQNEPAVAVDANHPNVLVAGANDNIDLEACNAGDPTTCPFTPGVGDSGRVLLVRPRRHLDAAHIHRPDGARLPRVPAALRPRPVGSDRHACPGTSRTGWSSGGDPAVAFGPMPDANGHFSWANGSRLYYANLTANFAATRRATFKGVEAIGVSRTDNVRPPPPGDAAGQERLDAAGDRHQAVLHDVQRQGADLGGQRRSPARSSATSMSAWRRFRSNSQGNAAPQPLVVATSPTAATPGPASRSRRRRTTRSTQARLRPLGLHSPHRQPRRGLRVRQPVRRRDAGAAASTSWSGPSTAGRTGPGRRAVHRGGHVLPRCSSTAPGSAA